MIRAVPVVTATSTVPELMEFLRYAIFDNQFAEVESILVNREKDFKAELEKLQKSHEALKQDLCLLEKKQSLAELENLMSEDELRKCEKERDELSGKLAKLSGDHEALSRRIKGGEERCRKLTEQLMEAEVENSRIILQLNDKFKGLERKMGEMLKYDKDKSRIVVDFAEIRKLLKRGKCETPGEKRKNEKGPYSTDLASGNELPSGKWVMPEAGHSSKLIHPSKDITGRLGSAGSALVFIDLIASDDDVPIERNAKVDNFDEKGMASAKSEEDRCSGLENEKTKSGCCENFPQGASNRKRSTSERKSDSENHMPIATGNRKSIHELYNDREQSFPAVCSRKADPKHPNVAEAFSYSKLNPTFIKHCEKVGNEQNPQLPLAKPFSYSKLNPTFIKHCEKVGNEQNPQLPLAKPILDGVDKSSNNSGSSGGRSYKDINVTRETTWTYAADMLSAFRKDPELCMNAVCALYRQQISAHKSTRRYSYKHKSLKQRGFCFLDAVKVSALAKYLINNDPENKLRRSVSDVRKVFPEMIDRCERLATQHYEELFEIYQKKLDPTFGPRF